MKIGNVSQMDEERAFAEFPFQLAYRLEKRSRFDVSDCASDLRDNEIIVSGLAEKFDITFDFVRDMRDYLYGLSEIIASTLLVDVDIRVEFLDCHTVSTT